MRRFDSLRIIPWNPKFTWVENSYQAADKINHPHEDYPKRVNATEVIISQLVNSFLDYQEGIKTFLVFSSNLKEIHREVFRDTSHAGKFRETEVIVGLHRPPEHLSVQKFMNELSEVTRIQTIEDLKDWYSDFETIHPFLDGNGRVGGTIVSALSNILEPEMGYLAPCQ